MNRLAILLAVLLLFGSTPPLVRRLELAPARWRAHLAFLALVGLALSTLTLLAAVLLPEVLVVSSFSQVWEMCARAFEAIWSRPLGRLPSVLAGAALSVILGRFIWALVAAARATRRARVRAGEPRWRLGRGEPVFVLPIGHPEAYSVGVFRRQVVLSEGLFAELDEEERRAVLLHEEAHLRGRHHAVLLMARALRAALRPLPSAGISVALLEQALEEIADEEAASRLGNAAVASGLSKAALAGLASPLGALSLAGGTDVPARVRRLLAPREVPQWMPIACLALAGLLLGALGLTQAIAGLAVVAAAHHVVGFGAAVTCPLLR